MSADAPHLTCHATPYLGPCPGIAACLFTRWPPMLPVLWIFNDFPDG